MGPDAGQGTLASQEVPSGSRGLQAGLGGPEEPKGRSESVTRGESRGAI